MSIQTFGSDTSKKFRADKTLQEKCEFLEKEVERLQKELQTTNIKFNNLWKDYNNLFESIKRDTCKEVKQVKYRSIRIRRSKTIDCDITSPKLFSKTSQ